MIEKLTYSKRVRMSGGMLMIPIPKEIEDEMELENRELVEVRITKFVK